MATLACARMLIDNFVPASATRRISMIGYVTLGTNDLPKAVAFYEKLLRVLGIEQVDVGIEGRYELIVGDRIRRREQAGAADDDRFHDGLSYSITGSNPQGINRFYTIVLMVGIMVDRT